MSKLDYQRSPIKCIELNTIKLSFQEKNLLTKWVLSKQHKELEKAYFNLDTDEGRDKSSEAMELERQLVASL